MAESIENMVRNILQNMNTGENGPVVSNTSTTPNTSSEDTSKFANATVEDYPIAEKHPDWVKTATGKGFDDLTLENVLNGKVTSQDVRITPDMLNAQGAISEASGRPAMKRNFSRAAELVSVPDERILEIYNSLRPYRSSKAELNEIADELENNYQATITAKYIREAADYYEKRSKLKGDN